MLLLFCIHLKHFSLKVYFLQQIDRIQQQQSHENEKKLLHVFVLGTYLVGDRSEVKKIQSHTILLFFFSCVFKMQ